MSQTHRAATHRGLAAGLFLATSLIAEEGDCADLSQLVMSQEISIGGIVRVARRDKALIGGGNGGTGTSVNFDDGDLDYGRGFTNLVVQGRTTLDGKSGPGELRIEAVYFYDFINADGRTDFHPLSNDARERAGRNAYLNDAYVGFRREWHEAALGVRMGNQILRWSDSPSFGYSIAPVNPFALSRRYQPGNKDLYVALPMLTFKAATPKGANLSAFYQLAFRPSEPEAAGTFLSSNDYYSPGARFLQLGQGSPLVPDRDASVVTAATPFGSLVPRAPDRRPSPTGQFGARIETAELGTAKAMLAAYAMQVHAREPIVSIRTGTLGGLLRSTAPDYTSSGAYFTEYPPHVAIVGASARLAPSYSTRLNVEYSKRFRQPLQIDDELLITAGLAPAAALGACAPNPASALCAGTLAALNRNPLVVARGGISPANAARLFSTEIAGYERFDVSQWAITGGQGLPPVLGAAAWSLGVESGGVHIHGFKEGFLDASVTSRPDARGDRRIAFASRSSWGYRLSTRLDYARFSPSLTWIHDVKGNAPITFGTLLEGNKSAILAVDARMRDSLTARVSYRSFLGKGSNADRVTDRDFVQFSVTQRF